MSVIRLTTCNNSIEANMLKNLLENEGIECFLTNEYFSNMMPGYSGMMGAGVGVMIDDKDLETAQKVLAGSASEQKKVCPYCGSEDIVFGLGRRKLGKIAVILLSLLLIIPFGNIRKKYFCKTCRSEFQIQE